MARTKKGKRRAPAATDLPAAGSAPALPLTGSAPWSPAPANPETTVASLLNMLRRALWGAMVRNALVTLFACGCIALLAVIMLEREQHRQQLREVELRRDFYEQKLRRAVQDQAEAHRYDGFYLSIDLENDELRVMRNGDVIHRALCAHGQGRVQRAGRWFDFSTPVGHRTVLRKETDPVWTRPDWAWLERGETLPRNLTQEQREVRGMLGKYRLQTGDGYDIHGTNGGVRAGDYSHGCIRLNDDDLEQVYKLIKVGAPVYIY